jgi:hypothetical protein
VQSPFNPFIEAYTETFYVIDKADITSIQCKMSLREPKSMRKVDGSGLIFFEFYVSALTPSLNNTETSLQLSEKLLCDLSHIYRCHQQRDLDRHHVFGVYRLYIDSTMYVTGRNLVALLLVYTLVYTIHLPPKL